jgi:hypothetical protein
MSKKGGRPSAWKSPTKAIRVPEHLADQLLALARQMEAGEVPTPLPSASKNPEKPLLEDPAACSAPVQEFKTLPAVEEFDELTEEERAAIALRTFKPKTDPDTIAQGLAEGWIVPSETH